MKNHSAPSKNSSKKGASSPSESAAGPEAVTLVPPSYGIDMVDRGLISSGDDTNNRGDNRTNSIAAQPAQTSTLPISMNSLPLQAKLMVNEPGDEFEQEADHVAGQVMRMSAGSGGGSAQRCACGGVAGPGGECESCKAKRLGLQRKGDSVAKTEAPPSVHQTLRTPGQPLDAGTRAFMEPRFGQDFSDVRVHTDSQAAQSAADVNAHAYTVGNDVVFGAAEYKNTDQGKELLAHEHVHVTQQEGSKTRLNRDEKNALKPKSQEIFIARVKIEPHDNYESVAARALVQRYGVSKDAALKALKHKMMWSGELPPGQVIKVTLDKVIVDELLNKTQHDETSKSTGGGEQTGTSGNKDGAGGEKSTNTNGGISGTEKSNKSGTENTNNRGTSDNKRTMTAEDKQRWQELVKLMQGATQASDENNLQEILRYYEALRDAVEDPQFSKDRGDSWVQFSKFLLQNKDKIDGIMKGNPPGRLTQEKIEKIISQY